MLFLVAVASAVSAPTCAFRYRPRQPRASPVWQVVRDHWTGFRAAYAEHFAADWGPLPAQAEAAVAAFLRCGDCHAGFTRLRCPHCGHEYLLPFTCKQRGLCATCHQRRALDEAALIADRICAPVPHRHVVLTVPRLLRALFRTRRALLGELCLAAREVLVLWLREQTGQPAGRPGLVVAVQTFGDFLYWHPHLHVMTTAGVFDPGGGFHLAPAGGWRELRELWRQAVLARLHRAGVLSAWQLRRLLAWPNGGFTLDAGPAPVAAADAAGRRRLAEYLLRAPFALEKLAYNPATGCVLYRSERHWRTHRNFEVFRAHDFLAALLAQLPVKGVPMVRYYGAYANKCRRHLRCTAGPSRPAPCPRRARTRWRSLLYRVWGADPLHCPHCDGFLRRLALVEQPAAIRAVLEPLGLYEGPAAPAQAPPLLVAPAAVSTWRDTLPPAASALPPDPTRRVPLCAPLLAYDAGDGRACALEPAPRRLHRAGQLPRVDPWYHRRWCVDAEHDFDHAGFELPPQPSQSGATGDDGQLALFADSDLQSFPPEEEPIFTAPPGWAPSARPQTGVLPAAARDDDAAQPFPPDDLPTLVYD